MTKLVVHNATNIEPCNHCGTAIDSYLVSATKQLPFSTGWTRKYFIVCPKCGKAKWNHSLSAVKKAWKLR
jgi:uncharacterized protein with PIN domain